MSKIISFIGILFFSNFLMYGQWDPEPIPGFDCGNLLISEFETLSLFNLYAYARGNEIELNSNICKSRIDYKFTWKNSMDGGNISSTWDHLEIILRKGKTITSPEVSTH